MEKRINPLLIKHFGADQHKTRHHAAEPRYEDTLADVLQPAYWSCVASHLRKGEYIRCLPEGMEWFAELICVYATQNTAHVKLLRHVVLADQKIEQKSSDYRIERDGRWHKIFRNIDNAMMGKALPSAEEAAAALNDILTARV